MTPRPAPTQHIVSADAVELACFEWNASARGLGPTLLLAHAAGFHARCWDQIIQRLGDRHIIAVDLRGHGRSTSVEIGDWSVIGKDLVAVISSFGLESVFGVGHSMGAHALVDAAANADAFDRFVGMYLFDPVIADPTTYQGGAGGRFEGVAEEDLPGARRRNEFESPRAMMERFKDRPPYSQFDPKVLRDYCEHGLIADEKGAFVLACAPRVEASIYMSGRGNARIFESVRAIKAPVLIVRARTPVPGRDALDFSPSPTWIELVQEFPNAREIQLPDANHLMPFEDPETIATQILEHLEDVEEGSPSPRD